MADSLVKTYLISPLVAPTPPHTNPPTRPRETVHLGLSAAHLPPRREHGSKDGFVISFFFFKLISKHLMVFEESLKGTVASKLGQSGSLSARYGPDGIISGEFDDGKQFHTR